MPNYTVTLKQLAEFAQSLGEELININDPAT